MEDAFLNNSREEIGNTTYVDSPPTDDSSLNNSNPKIANVTYRGNADTVKGPAKMGVISLVPQEIVISYRSLVSDLNNLEACLATAQELFSTSYQNLHDRFGDRIPQAIGEHGRKSTSAYLAAVLNGGNDGANAWKAARDSLPIKDAEDIKRHEDEKKRIIDKIETDYSSAAADYDREFYTKIPYKNVLGYIKALVKEDRYEEAGELADEVLVDKEGENEASVLFVKRLSDDISLLSKSAERTYVDRTSFILGNEIKKLKEYIEENCHKGDRKEVLSYLDSGKFEEGYQKLESDIREYYDDVVQEADDESLEPNQRVLAIKHVSDKFKSLASLKKVEFPYQDVYNFVLANELIRTAGGKAAIVAKEQQYQGNGESVFYTVPLENGNDAFFVYDEKALEKFKNAGKELLKHVNSIRPELELDAKDEGWLREHDTNALDQTFSEKTMGLGEPKDVIINYMVDNNGGIKRIVPGTVSIALVGLDEELGFKASNIHRMPDQVKVKVKDDGAESEENLDLSKAVYALIMANHMAI